MKDKQIFDWKKVKNSWETKLTLPLGLFVVSLLVLCVILGSAFYHLGAFQKENQLEQEQRAQKLQDNRDAFVVDNTLSEAFAHTTKYFLGYLGQYAHVVLFLIGISWLVHGVGFRIL